MSLISSAIAKDDKDCFVYIEDLDRRIESAEKELRLLKIIKNLFLETKEDLKDERERQEESKVHKQQEERTSEASEKE